MCQKARSLKTMEHTGTVTGKEAPVTQTEKIKHPDLAHSRTVSKHQPDFLDMAPISGSIGDASSITFIQ